LGIGNKIREYQCCYNTCKHPPEETISVEAPPMPLQNIGHDERRHQRAGEPLCDAVDRVSHQSEGNPGEKIEVKKELVNGKEEMTTVTVAALVQGNLAGYELREQFDYVTILVGRGFEEFPASYKGVSGGGIWYQQFITTDGKTYDVQPILAGVAVWQSKNPTIKNGWKVGTVTGHAWVSIYGHVRRALAEKRAIE